MLSFHIHDILSIPVAARSMAWIFGRVLVGIVSSNPAGGMDVSCEYCVLSGRGLSASDLSLVQRSPTDCGGLSVIVISR